MSQPTSETGEWTDKAAAVIKKEIEGAVGVSAAAMADWPICWPAIPQDSELKNLLADVASARSTKDNKVKARTIATEIFFKALKVDAIMEPYRKEASKSNRARLEDLTIEDLKKEQERMAARSAKIAEAMKKLESLNKVPKK